MRKVSLAIFLLTLVACQQNGGEPSAQNELELVWSDEFDYSGAPDSEKWSFDLGNGCPTLCGWGNNEKQTYAKSLDNARVKDGSLFITARRTKVDSVDSYSSARLVTKNKGDWKYGLIEVSAKLPTGTGTWPAIWMLPTNWSYGGWPKSGEIDIMEHVGYDPGNVHGTVHTEAFNHIKGTQRGDSTYVEAASEEFHNYAIKWTPEFIEFIVDGEVYNRFENNQTGPDAWPFDQPFHLILNIAVGGNWGGKHGIDHDIWPQQMEIDYVRVYRIPELTATSNNLNNQ